MDDIDMDMVEPEELTLFTQLTKAESIEDVVPKRRIRRLGVR